MVGFPYVFPQRSLLRESFPGFFAMSMLVLGGLVCHFMAWIRIYFGVRPASGAPDPSDGRIPLRRAFFLGVFGTVASFGLLPVQIEGLWPGTRNIWTYAVVFVSVFIIYSPFLPLVFGPVVLSHAYAFHTTSKTIAPGTSRIVLCASAVVLATISVGGIIGQLLLYPSWPPASSVGYFLVIPVPAGLTAIPYFAVRLASTVPGRLPRRPGRPESSS